MSELTEVEKYKALADDVLRVSSLYVRQNKAAAIMSEALKHLSWGELRELERYVFERLEK